MDRTALDDLDVAAAPAVERAPVEHADDELAVEVHLRDGRGVAELATRERLQPGPVADYGRPVYEHGAGGEVEPLERDRLVRGEGVAPNERQRGSESEGRDLRHVGGRSRKPKLVRFSPTSQEHNGGGFCLTTD